MNEFPVTRRREIGKKRRRISPRILTLVAKKSSLKRNKRIRNSIRR